MRFFCCLLIICLHAIACGGYNSERRVSSHTPEGGAVESELSAGLVGWKETVFLLVHEKAPSNIIAAIYKASDSWNRAVGFSLIEVSGSFSAERGGGLYSSLDDTFTVVYFEENWNNTTGKQAETLATTVWEVSDDSPDTIVRGDVILNAQYYYFSDALDEGFVDTGLQVADAETVLLHEMGHLLGLGHASDDEGSVMLSKTAVGYGAAKRVLSGQDIENIKQLYDE